MKKDQDHSVVTRWGGRAERYREFPLTQVRAHDPFGVQPLQFAHEFHYEAWVLERFSRTTQFITRKPTTVTAVIDGVEYCARATFVVTRRDGTVDYIIVSKTGGASAAAKGLRRIATANGARVIVLARTALRARVDEFWFWEKLRQVATLWARQGVEYDDGLVALVASGDRSLEEICSKLGAPSDLIRARLARLHVAGRLVVRCDVRRMTVSPAEGSLQ